MAAYYFQYPIVRSGRVRLSPPVTAIYTDKVDFWRRAYLMGGEDMVGLLDTALDAAPVFLRRMWDDTTRVRHDAPEFPELVKQLLLLVTPEQAAALLAPSMEEQP